MTRLVRIICCACVCAAALSSATLAESGRSDLDFLDGLSLIVLETSDIASLHRAKDLVHSYGGNIAIMSPPNLLIGWVPFDLRQEITGQAGIRDIFFTEVTPGEVPAGDEQSRSMIGFFNAAVRGELDYPVDPPASGPSDPAAERMHDAFDAPQLDEEAYLDNLRSAGLDIASLEDRGLLLRSSTEGTLGNSDYMTGTVALTIFFVESDGSGSDPDLYTWTPEDMQSYTNGVATGLTWWSNQALTYAGCWVTYLINYYSGADPRCQQWVEPILHPSTWQSTWIPAIMSNFGYTSGSYFSRVTAFNTWQRSYYQTDRSYSAFVPYNPSPAPAFFPDGRTAYAYLGGPFTVLLFRVGTSTPQVFAHETGHIFWACDEYAGGCSSCTATCGNGIANGNCETCNPDTRDCMMKFNTYNLCGFTPGQIGWGINSPCAPDPPPPLPAPTTTVSYPAQGFQGVSMTLTVGGTNFFPGAVAEIDDVFPHITTLIGAESLVVELTVFNTAAPGLRDITVRNRDGQTSTIPNAFEILPTRRHYFSPTGGNVFPYVTPADAATDFQQAIDATYDGDTLFVPTMTFSNASLSFDRGVTLSGAWDNTFTQRDLQTGKTVLDFNGSGDVVVFPGVTGAGLDGFVVENGRGVFDLLPFQAYFGGGIRVLDASATIANCEIRTNAASEGSEYGVGGGIYAGNGSVVIESCVITQNAATQGGGVYLINCTGSISNTAITGNALGFASETARGGAICLVDCPDITLVNNTVSGNLGATEGGGIHVENSTVVVDGGTIANQDATSGGGGLNIVNSTVLLDGATISGNTSGLLGGGIHASQASDLSMTECVLTANDGALGGALYAEGGIAAVDHNVFANNNASITGASAFLTTISSGSFAGNTIDSNTSSGVAGPQFSGAALEAYNNIVTNSTGAGVSCSDGATTLSYNLVWNNSGGDYQGCSAGPGSISADPLFDDAPGGDYHLALHSPAIDAGRPEAAYDDPDGSRGDMGRYGSHAFVMERPSYPKNLTAEIVSGSVVLTWNKNPEGDIASYAVYCDSTSGFVPSLANFVALVAGADSTTTLGAPGDSAFYRVSAVDTAGYASGYSNEATFSPPTAIGDPIADYRFTLHQNVPNPFNPVTRIAYDIHSRVSVSLDVYDVNGRLIKRLVRTMQEPGRYSAEWDGTNDSGARAASGIYFYRLQAGGFTDTRKMVLLK